MRRRDRLATKPQSARRPPFRALSFSLEHHPSPRRGVLFFVFRSPGRVAFGLIAAKGGGSGFNLRDSSKLPSLRTPKLPKRGVPEKACFGTMAKTEQ